MRKHYTIQQLENKVLRLFKDDTIVFDYCYDFKPTTISWITNNDKTKTLIISINERTNTINYIQLYYGVYTVFYVLDLNGRTYHRVKSHNLIF